MRALVISACCLLLLPLGCNSAANDPDAAANAAKAAAGALNPPTVQGPEGDEGPSRGDEPLPGVPGGPTVIKPPPATGTATCIVDDGDSGGHRDDGDDQKGPGGIKVPGGIKPIDPKTPTVEGAVPKSASKTKGSQALARSSTGTAPTAAGVTAVRLDWASICDEQMDTAACEDLCGSKGLTWDRSAGTNGSCFQLTAASSSGTTSTSAQCGCMCLPGS
ncbi:MAG: hypothetical protein KDK70_20800 [Myxococcales bacterium]|nr:hypothetical protein [Myxococcales bacterium]